jgi:DNA replication and repair protein RecF
VPIHRFKAERFRCLKSVSLQFDPAFNIVVGPNASGKTSLLEGIAYLGRARSFRGAPPTSLIQHGEKDFVLFGTADSRGRERSLGVRNGVAGLEVKIDGASDVGAADLAGALPLQVIDPEVHDLVAGGPEQRRRFLDGVAFHVEHRFIDAWRRYRRVLKQRNAVLRSGQSGGEVWLEQLVEAGEAVDEARRRVLEICQPSLEEQSSGLLGGDVRFEYRAGWAQNLSLEEALGQSEDRDVAAGSTQVGPHRADVKLVYDERQARRLVSRGQQKLLACSMVLAAAEVIQTALEEPLLLLLDDPAAELDADSLGRLVEQVAALGCQVVATSLRADAPVFPGQPRMFHVEHGEIEQVG